MTTDGPYVLAEVMVSGSVGASPGAPVPVQTVTFQVEHPGVAHELFVSPNLNLLGPPDAPVAVTFSIQGPNGATVLPERTEHCIALTASRNQRAGWEGKTFSVPPTVLDAYTM